MTAFSVRRAGAWFASEFKNSADLGDGPFIGGAPPTYPTKGWVWSSHGTSDPRRRHPTIDLTQGCDSPGSLYFYSDPFEGQGNTGNWSTNFSTDDTIFIGPAGERTGARQEYYAQVRVRWSSSAATTQFNDNNGDPQQGTKFFDMAGLLPRDTTVDADGSYGYTGTSSCNKSVVQTDVHGKFPKCYGYVRNPSTGGVGVNFDFSDGGLNPQNLMPAPYCSYGSSFANCATMPANEWVTITIREKNLGRSALTLAGGGPDFCDFEFDMWFQRDGQSRVKIHTWNSTQTGYAPKYWGHTAAQGVMGVITMFPYMTNLSTTQSFSRAEFWYDQLIIGPNDPGTADAAGTISTLQTSSYPKVLVR